MTPNELEKAYENFTQNVKQWLPDGLIQIDLETLCEMGLVNGRDFDHEDPDEVTQYFHVLETPDKITLYNEKFAVWIVPNLVEDIPITHTYISQIRENTPQLELVYENCGIYNSPKFILKVLEHFLIETLHTDAIISSMGNKEE